MRDETLFVSLCTKAMKVKLHIIDAHRDGSNAIYSGYKYNKRKIIKNGTIFWVCRHVGCKSSMTTDAEFVILRKPKEHSHDLCESCNVANMLIDGMRKRSREYTTIPQIYEQERKKMVTDDYCIKPSDIAFQGLYLLVWDRVGCWCV